MLAHNSLQADNISPAVIYRVVEDRKPTLLIDEADSAVGSGRGAESERAEAIRGLVNGGFGRTGKVIRCDGPTHQVKEFPAPMARRVRERPAAGRPLGARA